MVAYDKPYLTLAQQVEKLRVRGIALEGDHAQHVLERIGYYRLSGYWYPYRILDRNASRGSVTPVRRSGVGLGGRHGSSGRDTLRLAPVSLAAAAECRQRVDALG
jgi:hypothetical protein